MSFGDMHSFVSTEKMEAMISVTNNGLKYIAVGNKKSNKYLFSYYEEELKELTLNSKNGKITSSERERFLVESAAKDFASIFAERIDGREKH